MLSIIVCYVNEDQLEKLRSNIAQTIGNGVEYEVIAENNSRLKRPIAEVYNTCASRARYQYLLFIHEDAGFVSTDWYAPIAERLSKKECGVIGFAGAQGMYNCPGSWFADPALIAVYMEQSGNQQSVKACPERPWVNVVAVDGYAMFVRREVWQIYPFDEKNLSGFHCYDVDFSLCIARHYRNYVCGCVLTYHNSKGNYDEKWIEQTLNIYDSKWRDMLPMFASEDLASTGKELIRKTERAHYRIIKRVAEKNRIPSRLLSSYRSYPLTFRKLEHYMKIIKSFISFSCLGLLRSKR